MEVWRESVVALSRGNRDEGVILHVGLLMTDTKLSPTH